MKLQPFLSSTMLTKCITVNQSGIGRQRYVDFQSFRLWEYLVTHKHGLQVGDEIHCLWLSEEEFSKNENVHRHSGEVEPVDRIVFSVYDESLGFNTIIDRFTHDSDSSNQLDMLNSHLAEQNIKEDVIESTIIPGYAVERHP